MGLTVQVGGVGVSLRTWGHGTVRMGSVRSLKHGACWASYSVGGPMGRLVGVGIVCIYRWALAHKANRVQAARMGSVRSLRDWAPSGRPFVAVVSGLMGRLVGTEIVRLCHGVLA